MTIALSSTLSSRFREEAQSELRRLPASIASITETDLQPLPRPVQRYFRKAGFVGRPHTLNARITWDRMRLRRSSNSGWLELAAEQLSSVAQPARIAWMRGKLAGIIPLEGRDKYQAHRGSLRIQLCKVVRIAEARGPQVDASELVTVLSESLLVPSCALQPYVHWSPRDDRSASAELRDGGEVVRGVFYFNHMDEYVRFETRDRFQDGHPPRRYPWSADLSEYHTVDGLCLPSRLSATWHEPDGDFRYFEGSISAIEFNVRAWNAVVAHETPL